MAFMAVIVGLGLLFIHPLGVQVGLRVYTTASFSYRARYDLHWGRGMKYPTDRSENKFSAREMKERLRRAKAFAGLMLRKFS